MTQLWSETAVRAVCWTLVHSLWLGILAAGAGGLVVLMTVRSSARLRYNLLSGCLAVFAAVTAGIFLYEWGRQTRVNPAPDGFSPAFLSTPGFIHGQRPIAGIGDWLIFFIDQHSRVIFMIWLSFFLFKTLQFTGGFVHIHRIRTRRVSGVPGEWEANLASLSQKLGIKQSVRLLQSELVNVPVTVGHFKPVILVPVGIFLQLPPAQIETIILHELAHIRRRDYLVNILQTMLETLFFFNPAVLWLSGLIREEREACCDDIVLAQNPIRRTYLEALLAFHPRGEAISDSLAVGLGGNGLVNRLKRIIDRKNRCLEVPEKLMLLASVMVICACCYKTDSEVKTKVHAVRAAPNKADKPARGIPLEISPKQAVSAIKKEVMHSASSLQAVEPPPYDIPRHFESIRFIDNNHDLANRQMIVRDEHGDVYQLKFTDNILVTLEVNGNGVPTNEMMQYQKLVLEIEQARQDAQARKARAIKERIMLK